jgi:hypothetical protein
MSAMSHRRVLLVGLCCLILAPLAAAFGDAKDQPDKKYRLEMPVAKAGATEPHTIAADVFLDKKASLLFYAVQQKSLAIAPGDEKTVGKGDKEAKQLYRHVLKVRKWDDNDMDDKTPRTAVEVFRDENNGNLVYVSDTGSVAVVPAPKEAPGKKAPETKWLYRLKLKVRPAGETCFAFGELKCNVEVYRESDSGRLLYVTEYGNLAVCAPGRAFDAKEAKGPEWSHALELKVRPPEQNEWKQDTPKFGIEVYNDPNSQTTLYVPQTFAVAAVPGIKAAKDMSKPEPPEWKRGMAAGKWSAEVYHNPNADHLIFISSGGGLAVRPAK